MPGLGTGFNAKIKSNLFSFLSSCYEGMQEQVDKELDPKEGINREFTEIKQYLGIIRKETGHNPEVAEKLLIFLEACYKNMDYNLSKTGNLREAIKLKFSDLEKYIDTIEKKQKSQYGSIWEQKVK